MRTFFGVVCVLMAVFSFSIAAVGLVEIFSGIADAGAYGASVFLGGIGGVSTWGAWRNLRGRRDDAPALPPADPTKVVLALAAHEGGRLTLTEVVAKTPLSLPEAQAALAALTRENFVTSIVTDEGVEVFTVRGLLAPAEKASARDILDS